MRGKALLIGGALVLIAATAAFYLRLNLDQLDQAVATVDPSASAPPLLDTNSPATARPDNPQLQQLLENSAVQAHGQRLAFHQAFLSFVSEAAALSPEQRESQAQALREQIEAYEQRNELAMSEALLLHLSLIQLTISDEQAQKDQAAALVARYKARSAEREAQVAAPSLEFERYKAQEKLIVEQVLNMDRFPDGLSRDEYLRQRLQQAREQHYQ